MRIQEGYEAPLYRTSKSMYYTENSIPNPPEYTETHSGIYGNTFRNIRKHHPEYTATPSGIYGNTNGDHPEYVETPSRTWGKHHLDEFGIGLTIGGVHMISLRVRFRRLSLQLCQWLQLDEKFSAVLPWTCRAATGRWWSRWQGRFWSRLLLWWDAIAACQASAVSQAFCWANGVCQSAEAPSPHYDVITWFDVMVIWYD